MSDLASDGTPLMRPYTEHAEHRADILMQERERAAADAATGLARLDAARARVDAADTVRLGVAIRHWRRKATGTSPER